MTHVFVTGLAVLDFVFALDELPRPDEKHRARSGAMIGGGGGANAAVAVARLGGQASLGARLGQDVVGDLILSELSDEGVNLEATHRQPGAISGYSSIYVTPDGGRQIVSFRGEGLTSSPAFLNVPHTAGAVLADSRWPEGARHVLEQAQQRSIPGVVDAEAPVELDAFSAASHIAFSRQGLLDLTGETDVARALAQVAPQTPAWVSVTDGSDGVYFMQDGAVSNLPAFPVDVHETLGAGDVWHGAFALRLAEGADERTAMTFANAAAALKCAGAGGRKSYPDRKDTEMLLSAP